MNAKHSCRLIVKVAFLLALQVETQAVADTSPPGRVYLWGEVHKQGALAVPANGLTVVQAIIMDGGLGDMADPHQIKVLRRKSDGSSQVIPVDWNQIVGGGTPEHPVKANFANDVELLPGDIIVVAKKVINY